MNSFTCIIKLHQVFDIAFMHYLLALAMFPRCLCRLSPGHCRLNVFFDVVKEIQVNELWPSQSTCCISHFTEEDTITSCGKAVKALLHLTDPVLEFTCVNVAVIQSLVHQISDQPKYVNVTFVLSRLTLPRH